MLVPALDRKLIQLPFLWYGLCDFLDEAGEYCNSLNEKINSFFLLLLFFNVSCIIFATVVVWEYKTKIRTDTLQ